MDITIIRDAVTRHELNDMAKEQFGDMVKAVVDVKQGIMAIGGGLHSDEEAMLPDQGAAQKHQMESSLVIIIMYSRDLAARRFLGAEFGVTSRLTSLRFPPCGRPAPSFFHFIFSSREHHFR
jgi:Protein of unknown function (DUF5674)